MKNQIFTLRVKNITAGFIVLIFTVCSVFAQDGSVYLTNYHDDDFIEANKLIVFQSSLSIPEGWTFSDTDTDDPDEKFFSFSDINEVVYGAFYYYSLDEDITISATKLADFYAKNYFKPNYKNIKIYDTRIEGDLAEIVTGSHKEKGWDRFTLLIPEGGNNFNEITLIADKDYLFTNPEIAYKIFESYSYAKKGINERIIKGAISFKSTSSDWRWYDDKEDKGFYVKGEINDKLVLVGLSQTKYMTLDALLEGYDFETIDFPRFSKTLNIGGREITFEGVGIIEDEFSKYWMIPTDQSLLDEPYLLYFGIEGDDKYFDVSRFLDEESIQNLLENNIYYN